MCLLLQHQMLPFFGITCADVGQVKFFTLACKASLAASDTVEWNTRSAVSSSSAAKVALCTKTSAFYAAYTACGQALVSPKIAATCPFLGGERNALPSMISPSSNVTVLPCLRRPFRRNRRYRRNVCVWVLSLRHLAFWMRRLFRGGRDSLATARLDCAPVGRGSPNRKGRCRGRLKK